MSALIAVTKWRRPLHFCRRLAFAPSSMMSRPQSLLVINKPAVSWAKKTKNNNIQRPQQRRPSTSWSQQHREAASASSRQQQSHQGQAANATRSNSSRQRSWQDRADDFLRQPRTLPIPRWISPRHYTYTLTECFGHSSFLLVAISYAVDDFLQLRILAVAGSTVMLVFTYFHPYGRVLWLPFKWNILFIVLNSYRIGKAYLDRYLAEQLPEELLRIRRDHFYVVSPVAFAKLARLGHLETFQEGEVLVTQGENNRYVRLVLSGELKVLRDGKLAYRLQEGNFVSESGLHAGILLGGKVESCCTIVANGGTARVLRWDRTELMDLLHRDDGLCRSLKAVLSWDVVRKLKAQRDLISDGIIVDPEQWTLRRQRQSQHRYTAILRNVLSHPDFFKDHKAEINNYRIIHDIDDERHRLALQQCGWTPDEFERGVKDGDEIVPLPGVTSEDDAKHDWRWFVRDLYERLLG